MINMTLARNCLASVATLFILVQPAEAVFIDEAGLDSIFSQTNFGANPIDIRLRQEIEIVSPGLVNIDFPTFDPADPFSLGELDDLFALGTEGPVIDLFFVDSIFGPPFNTVGVAEFFQTGPVIDPRDPLPGTFGNGTAVDKDFTGSILTEIIAHEVGHTLQLQHVGLGGPPFFEPIPGFPNLMAPNINGNTTLTLEQVSIVFMSDWVQGDAMSGFFIELQPYDVVGVATPSAVPLPAAFPLFVGGLGLMGFIGNRRKRSASTTT